MKAKWIISRLSSDRAMWNLSYAVQEADREVEVLSIDECLTQLYEPNNEVACKVVIGTILVTKTAKENRPNWIPGSWHIPDVFKCSNYYSYWGKYLTQKNYAFLPLGEVIRRKEWIYATFAKDESLFIRPDYGEKSFNGEVVSIEHFEEWVEHVQSGWAVPMNTMCVVSSIEKIGRELRLVIADGKVVTGSVYKVGRGVFWDSLEKQTDSMAIVEFAEKVVADNPPSLPSVYVLDVGETDGVYSVIEVGCFCCAGLYECDLRKIASKVSEAAEKEFADIYHGDC